MEHKNAVLVGLESMRQYDGIGDGVVYSVEGVNYTTDQMIAEIKNETNVGKKFAQEIYNNIISYMSKFSQKVQWFKVMQL